MLNYAEYKDYENIRESIQDCRDVLSMIIERHTTRQIPLPPSLYQMLISMQQRLRNAVKEAELHLFQLAIAEEQRQQSLEFEEWCAKNFEPVENPEDVFLPDDAIGY